MNQSKLTHFHQEIVLNPGELLSVKLTERAKIRLIDADNYNRFAKGERYRYLGRSAPRQEVTLRPTNQRPRSWHLVIFPEEPEAEMALSAEVNIFS